MNTLDSTKLLQFLNCRLLRNHQIVKDDMWVRKGKIVNPEEVFFDEKISADVQINCQGALICPGFIDIQINGGFGIDFSYNIEDVEGGIQKVAKGLLSHGVTSFCPTIVTSSIDVYHKVLPQLKRCDGSSEGATILGIHIEGPFINTRKSGAHSKQLIQTLDKGMKTVMETYGSLKDVSIVTLAPELDNALEVIERLSKEGITVSLGHSMANLQEGEEAVQAGASFITHLFNAMLPFHHRDPGLVGLLASSKLPKDKRIYFGIISDGIHTHPAALRIAHRTHPRGLVLVTDAISALGLQEGTHHIGQLSIEILCGQAKVTGTETLCGSIATLNQCVQFFKEATGCSEVNALEAATLHPAEAIGVQRRKGTLNYGADADFILLGDDLKVWSTWIAGECVYIDTLKPQTTFKQRTATS